MRRTLSWIVAALGVALAVAGIALFVAANRGPADFGWWAYAPLQPTQDTVTHTFANNATVLWTGQHLLGAGLLVLGLLLLTGVAGWLLGWRAGRRTAPST
jgi:heme/copper-type cytochrome/quinol oxidase subunit 1